ncbi:MAG: flavodoxin domain-containing protein [Porphyromonadaceae bacterium]|nr:flavodoxin domain-containing protein [Porphyromonadaceae bacterium]
MDNTLIVFASNHGTVDKYARELFRLIDGKVDICNLNEREMVPDLTKYDSVIVGGAIQSGKMQEEISLFCEKHLDELVVKRLGLFIHCPLTGENAQKLLDGAYPKELKDCAVVRDYFGVEANQLKMNIWERIVTTQMIKKKDLIVELLKEKIERFARVMSEADNIPDNRKK